MDKNKLPINIGTTLIEYLQKTLVGVPAEILTIALLTKIAQVSNLNRSKIRCNLVQGGDGTMQPTIYSIFFASSGTGKDRLVNTFDFEIFPEIKDRFNSIYQGRSNQILEDAFSDIDGEMTPSKEKDIRAQNQLHDYRWKITHGTFEGLLAAASSIDRAGCGCIFYQHSEFVDMLQRRDENAMLMIDSLKELYDGRITNKLIKQDKQLVEINHCPTVMLAFSAIEGIEDEQTRAKIFELFTRGFARRSYVVLESLSDAPRRPETVEEMDELTRQANGALPYVQSLFATLFIETAKAKVYAFDDGANKLLQTYEINNAAKPSISTSIGKVLNPERIGRAWKAMQMAGLIAMFEHPEVNTVTVQDVELAIYLTELFGSHLESFFVNLSASPEQRLYTYLLKRKGELVTRTDLRAEKFVYPNTFRFWLDGAIEDVTQVAAIQGYIVESKEIGTSKYLTLFDPKDEK